MTTIWLFLQCCFSLNEYLNKLREYQDWVEKAGALHQWLEMTDRKLDCCSAPSEDEDERDKQKVFLQVRKQTLHRPRFIPLYLCLTVVSYAVFSICSPVVWEERVEQYCTWTSTRGTRMFSEASSVGTFHPFLSRLYTWNHKPSILRFCL